MEKETENTPDNAGPARAGRPGRPRQGGKPTAVRALDRGLSILETLSQQAGGLTLAQVSRQTKLPPATAYRLLETLRTRGFIAYQPERGIYSVGIRAFQVGGSFLTDLPLHELARPPMQALCEEINENINLAIRDGNEVVYIAQLQGTHSLRMFTQVGARAPLHCTGVGKVLMAAMSDVQITDLLGPGPYQKFTEKTLVSRRSLIQAVRQVREQGYTVDDEERQAGVFCVTAPVRDHHGEIAAAVSISAPLQRMAGKTRKQRLVQVLELAGTISQRLGFVGK